MPKAKTVLSLGSLTPDSLNKRYAKTGTSTSWREQTVSRNIVASPAVPHPERPVKEMPNCSLRNAPRAHLVSSNIFNVKKNITKKVVSQKNM
jgi:hypothetical protein